MEEKIKSFIDSLFDGTPLTPNVQQLKDETVSAAIDRYRAAISSGKAEETAYNIAISGIGDIQSKINEAAQVYSQYTPEEIDANKKRSALMTSVSIMLYILCVVPCIIIQNEIGVCLMFIMIAAATGLLIYNAKTRIKNTVAEQKSNSTAHKSGSPMYKSISSLLWTLIVIIYLVLSFSTGAWHITWLMFLIGAALDQIVKILFDFK